MIPLLLAAAVAAATPDLELRELRPGIWLHTSWQALEDGTRFPSNGLVVREGNGLVLVDTAWGDPLTEELLDRIERELKLPVVRAVATHFHDDRLGGAATLKKRGIPLYAHPLTIAKMPGLGLKPLPASFGSLEVYYPGPAHAPDNVVVWIPGAKVLFGGCAVRSANSTALGNLSDADLLRWHESIRNVMRRYGDAEIVVPGHGKPGGKELLERTLELTRAVDLSSFFPGMDACFVLADGDDVVRFHAERAATRFTPASTFKIPNSLIALETGVADGPGFPLQRDPAQVPEQPWWPEAWKHDQVMRTAIRDSVVWYYQEIARRIGETRMQEWVDRFDYGNRDLSPAIDRFWLQGGLKISPDEEVRFLQRMLGGKLGVSERTTSTVRSMLLLEDGDGFRLYGKTGTASVTETRETGWLVGWVETAEGTRVYALNMEGEEVWERWPPAKRKELVLAILDRLGVLRSRP